MKTHRLAKFTSIEEQGLIHPPKKKAIDIAMMITAVWMA